MVCLYCAQELVFDDVLTPCKPTRGQIEAIFAEDSAFAEEVQNNGR